MSLPADTGRPSRTSLATTPMQEGHGVNSQWLACRDFALRYRFVLDPQRALAFPCDDAGRVDMDKLSAQALNNYLYARAFVGKEFLSPEVHPICPGSQDPGTQSTRSVVSAGRQAGIERSQDPRPGPPETADLSLDFVA